MDDLNELLGILGDLILAVVSLAAIVYYFIAGLVMSVAMAFFYQLVLIAPWYALLCVFCGISLITTIGTKGMEESNAKIEKYDKWLCGSPLIKIPEEFYCKYTAQIIFITFVILYVWNCYSSGTLLFVKQYMS